MVVSFSHIAMSYNTRGTADSPMKTFGRGTMTGNSSGSRGPSIIFSSLYRNRTPSATRNSTLYGGSSSTRVSSRPPSGSSRPLPTGPGPLDISGRPIKNFSTSDCGKNSFSSSTISTPLKTDHSYLSSTSNSTPSIGTLPRKYSPLTSTGLNSTTKDTVNRSTRSRNVANLDGDFGNLKLNEYKSVTASPRPIDSDDNVFKRSARKDRANYEQTKLNDKLLSERSCVSKGSNILENKYINNNDGYTPRNSVSSMSSLSQVIVTTDEKNSLTDGDTTNKSLSRQSSNGSMSPIIDPDTGKDLMEDIIHSSEQTSSLTSSEALQSNDSSARSTQSGPAETVLTTSPPNVIAAEFAANLATNLLTSSTSSSTDKQIKQQRPISKPSAAAQQQHITRKTGNSQITKRQMFYNNIRDSSLAHNIPVDQSQPKRRPMVQPGGPPPWPQNPLQQPHHTVLAASPPNVIAAEFAAEVPTMILTSSTSSPTNKQIQHQRPTYNSSAAAQQQHITREAGRSQILKHKVAKIRDSSLAHSIPVDQSQSKMRQAMQHGGPPPGPIHPLQQSSHINIPQIIPYVRPGAIYGRTEISAVPDSTHLPSNVDTNIHGSENINSAKFSVVLQSQSAILSNGKTSTLHVDAPEFVQQSLAALVNQTVPVQVPRDTSDSGYVNLNDIPQTANILDLSRTEHAPVVSKEGMPPRYPQGRGEKNTVSVQNTTERTSDNQENVSTETTVKPELTSAVRKFTLKVHKMPPTPVEKESKEELVAETKDTEVPVYSLPVEILRMDTQSIELYKQLLTEGKEDVHTIRVMVVGQFGVGKTALTQRLLRKHVDIKTRDSTNGIEVHVKRCKVSLKDGKWTVLKQDDKLENTFKRLASMFAHQKPNNHSLDKPELNIQERESDMVGSHKNTHDVTQKEYNTPTPQKTDDLDTGQDNSNIPMNEDTILEHIKEVIQETNNLKDTDSDYADLSIWDFAGQYAFYATHQVFLSSRAVYLLVTDISKPLQDVVVEDKCDLYNTGSKPCSVSEFVEFWLNSIHEYSSSQEPEVPPVILVGTHADKLDQGKEKELSDQYFDDLRKLIIDKDTRLHLVDADFPINNAIEDQNLTQLKDKIFEVASKQQYWGELIPARWITLEKAIIELRSEGLKICERTTLLKINQALPVPLSSDKEVELFLRFHHDSGNILYFSHEDLCDYILLDPQWLVDAFKCLITADMFLKKKPEYKQWLVFNTTGKLEQKLIDAVWKVNEFHDHREHLIALLERLDIIARPKLFVDDEKQTQTMGYFFAPSVLKDPPPQEVLLPCNSTVIVTSRLCFTLTTTFVPIAMFNRLMAACLTQWPLSKKGKDHLIFCGCGVFDVDNLHRLTLLFSQDVIQIWVTKYAELKPHPNEDVCMQVRTFIAETLTRMQVTSQFKTCFKCPFIPNVRSGVGMFDLKDVVKQEEVACHYHDKPHIIKSADMLRYWKFNKANDDDVSASGIVCSKSSANGMKTKKMQARTVNSKKQ